MKNITTHPRGGVKGLCHADGLESFSLTDRNFLPAAQPCSHRHVGMTDFFVATVCRRKPF